LSSDFIGKGNKKGKKRQNRQNFLPVAPQLTAVCHIGSHTKQTKNYETNEKMFDFSVCFVFSFCLFCLFIALFVSSSIYLSPKLKLIFIQIFRRAGVLIDTSAGGRYFGLQ
jgi:hypothetical protein